MTDSYLQLVVEGFPWFTSISAYTLIPVLIPALIIGAGGAAHGFQAPPSTLNEIAGRMARALLLFALIFLAILCLWSALLLNSPPGGFLLTMAIPTLISVPLVACWLFGLACRLGYDLGLLSAHIHAARWQSRRKAQRRSR